MLTVQKPTRPAVALLIAALCGTATAQSYSVTDLGVISPYTVSRAMAINAAGQITGWLETADGAQTEAFYYNGATLSAVGATGGTKAYAINDAGQISGILLTTDNLVHAFLYSNLLLDLSSGSSLNTYALGINSDGVVCGAGINSAGQTHAYTWQNGVPTDIHLQAWVTANSAATPTGRILLSTFSEARDINDSSEVVGYFTAPTTSGTTTEIAFYYKNATLTELGSLGGTKSHAIAISASGRIVGWSETSAGLKRATVFYTNGNMLNLGTTSTTATWSAAYAVNDSGVAVGESGTSDASVAFIYKNNATTDLNTLIPSGSGWTLQAATGINNAGRISGYGQLNGQTHAYLLTPGSSPSTGSDISTTGTGTSSLCGSGAGLPVAFMTLYALAVTVRRRRVA